METLQLIFGSAFILFGVIFSVLGVVGIIRLPDTLCRLHATGKTGTLGVLGLCVGVAILEPQFAGKLLALAIFIIFSAPVASHAIGAAILRSGDEAGSSMTAGD